MFLVYLCLPAGNPLAHNQAEEYPLLERSLHFTATFQAMTRRRERTQPASARTGPGQHSYGNAVAAT